MDLMRAVLEVEQLEERNTPTPVTPTPTAASASPPRPVVSGLDIVPLVGTNASAGTGILVTTISQPTLSSPVVPIVAALVPTGAGTVPLNNSVPNAAATLSSGAGLNSLSPFLPAYYIGYTQVGPFYTGSDVPVSRTPGSDSYHPVMEISDEWVRDDTSTQPADVSADADAVWAMLSINPILGVQLGSEAQ